MSLPIAACSCSSLDGCSCSVSADDLTIPGSYGFSDDTDTAILEWSLNCNSADGCSLLEEGGNTVLRIFPGAPGFAINSDSTTTCLVDDVFCIDNTAGSGSLVIDGSGRVGIGTAVPTEALEVDGNARFSGTFSVASSRDVKRGFEAVDSREVLETLAGLSITEWSYLDDESSARHMGPVAEEFGGAFGLGGDARYVSPVDLSGVAFAAIQGLYQVVLQRDAEIAALERSHQALRVSRDAQIRQLQRDRDRLADRLDRLERLVALNATSASPDREFSPHR